MKTHSNRRVCLGVGLTIAGLAGLILVGCTATSKYKVLSFFFDGVPAPGSHHTNAVVVVKTSVTTNAPTVVKIVSKITVHQPFGDNKCSECHESQFSQRMKMPLPKLCFECHDDFLEKAKVKHQPVESGECMSCHEPHSSPNKKLLLRTGRTMCLECHDDPAKQGKVVHQPVEADCLDCHNPHASGFKGLLKKKVVATCFDCHDDFLKTAKFKHQPVEDGDCMACHKPHNSNFKGLLKKSVNETCAECHEAADLAKVAAHKLVTPSTVCIQCHDPHTGSDKNFLRGEAKKAAEAAAQPK